MRPEGREPRPDKAGPTSLIIREMQINATTMSYHLTPVRTTTIKKTNKQQVLVRCGQKGTLCIVWPQIHSREGRQLHPSTENWIKDLLSMAPPIRTRPSIPLSLSHQEASISLYPSPSEGRQTENHNHRKPTNLITWTTALFNSIKL